MNIRKFYYNNGNIKSISYYVNNKLHRLDGPAYISYYENGNIEYEGYYVHGKRHRLDGPAYSAYCEDGSVEIQKYFINGNVCNELQYCVIMASMKGD